MANSLSELIREYDVKKYATDAGIQFHEKLRSVSTIDDNIKVDYELKRRIESCDGLLVFFTKKSETEVPMAGMINGVFTSRRIDRLVVDDENKVVRILDYKTDTDKKANREKYVNQLHEYAHLMREIYPEYKIEKYIVWLHDWTLEKL